MAKAPRGRSPADAAGTIVEPFYKLLWSKSVIRVDGDRAVIARRFLADLLRPMLMTVRFDPDYYRRTYKDLAEAERNGVIADLQEHYVSFGYFENRLPCRVEVDGSFYAREYPDVAAAIMENKTPSAQHHFEMVGFAEGRAPRKGWTFAELVQG